MLRDVKSSLATLALFLAVSLPAATPIDPAKVIDLTHTFDASTIYWPTEKGFQWEKEVWGKTEGGYFYASARCGAAERGGTHVATPIHCGEGKGGVDHPTVKQLSGPAVVIGGAGAGAKNADFRPPPADIAAWEKAHGTIPAGSIVLFRT